MSSVVVEPRSAVEGKVLPQEFFARPADIVARGLVGKILWREGVGGGRLTEVEAYLPQGDPASHSYRGRSERNSSMFGPPGHLYVYISYGVHALLNVVCDMESIGSAVLIRAFEAVGDSSVMMSNRLEGMRSRRRSETDGDDGSSPTAAPSAQRAKLRWLGCGPGRIGQALGIGLELDGLSLGAASGLYVIDDGASPCVSSEWRVGISKGVELPLRYLDADSGCVSNVARAREV